MSDVITDSEQKTLETNEQSIRADIEKDNVILEKLKAIEGRVGIIETGQPKQFDMESYINDRDKTIAQDDIMDKIGG